MRYLILVFLLSACTTTMDDGLRYTDKPICIKGVRKVEKIDEYNYKMSTICDREFVICQLERYLDGKWETLMIFPKPCNQAPLMDLEGEEAFDLTKPKEKSPSFTDGGAI